MLEELPLVNWNFSKRSKECDIYHKKVASTLSCFRVDTEFDFPPELVLNYIKDPVLRMKWDDGLEFVKEFKQFPLNTMLTHGKVKGQFPISGREVLLVF